MSHYIINAIGLFGTFLILFFYFLSQYFYKFLNSKMFYFSNILGSSLIIFSLIFGGFNLPSFCIESLWILISIYGYYKHCLNKNSIMNITKYLPQSPYTFIMCKNPEKFKNKNNIFYFITDDLSKTKMHWLMILGNFKIIQKDIIILIQTVPNSPKIQKLIQKNLVAGFLDYNNVLKNAADVDIIIKNVKTTDISVLKKKKRIKINFGNVDFNKSKIPTEVILF